jgi:phosphoribosyl 1,2-cyclic phosphodiesterase
MDSAASKFRVTFRGVRGSIPSPGPQTARYGGNTSCVELRVGDEIIILDAGSGLRQLGADLTSEFGTAPISATLIISHTHWDHIQGLPFFLPAYSTHNRIRLCAAPGWGKTITRALNNQMDPIHFPVPLTQLGGLSAVEEFQSDDIRIGRARIRTTELHHPGGCAGFRIEVANRTIAYLPDHEPFATGENDSLSAGLIEFVRGADLLILDTQYTDAEYCHRRGWGHGSLSESVAIARRAEVKHLALFHHDPAHNDEQIDEMVEAARAVAGGVFVTAARENESVTPGQTNLAVLPPACAAR